MSPTAPTAADEGLSIPEAPTEPGALEATDGVAFPVMRLLDRLKVRHAAEEVEEAEHRELGKRAPMDARGGGEGNARTREAGLHQELANAGAGSLHPGQPGRRFGKPCRIGLVEVEEDIGL